MQRLEDSDVTIGEYRLGRTLGKGTFGTVRLAEHIHSGRIVAVKIIPEGKMAPEALEREVGNQRRLDHPNIIAVLEVLKRDGSTFIVMEYAESELYDYLVLRGKLGEKDAKRLFSQLIAAVQHCHSRMVVHRDLKPENLLMDCNNNLKLADFGLSSVWCAGEFLTDSCGSPNYAAPELLSRGCRYEGPEVDVWSCGVILYAFLCNCLPFDKDGIPELFRLIKRGQYSVPGYITTDAADLIQRMLTVDQAKRITLPQIMEHPWLADTAPIRAAEVPKVEAPLQQVDIQLPHVEALPRAVSMPLTSAWASTCGKSACMSSRSPWCAASASCLRSRKTSKRRAGPSCK